MSFLDDAAYNWHLALYKMGLKSTPPIVMPVDASPELKAEVKKLETDYSNINIIKNTVSTTFDSITNGIKGLGQNVILILILVIIIYFIGKKELAKI